MRRSELTELATTLATAQKFTRKRPFPFHNSGTTQPAFPCKRARNSQNLYQQARATNGKTSALAHAPLPTMFAPALPGQGDAKTAVLPAKTSATPNGRSQPTRPSSPKPAQPTCAATAKTAAVASPLAENVCANLAGQRPNKTGLCLPKPAPKRKSEATKRP